MRKEPTEKTLKAWRKIIRENGIKQMKARELLKHFGVKRRGPRVQELVDRWSKSQTSPIHVSGLAWVRSLDEFVDLSPEPMTQIGFLVAHEKELKEPPHVEILMRALGRLTVIEREFRPKGARDRLDFLCKDREGQIVVVELKKDDGEKHGVEQVLRYMQYVRKDQRYHGCNPRGVLVTGRADASTRRALEELEQRHPEFPIEWWLYGLTEDHQLRLEPVRSAHASRPTSR